MSDDVRSGSDLDPTPERVALTEAAAEMLRGLWDRHGPLMFHQSGGCCDGSSPMCFADGDFITSEADVHLGDLTIEGPDPESAGSAPRTVPVWMSVEQYEVWRHTHLTIDLVRGRGAGFSLEAPTGHRFLIRSRLLDPRGGAGGPDALVSTGSTDPPGSGSP